MTRKSKREIERALEDIVGDNASPTWERDYSPDERAAIRAVLRYRRKAYPDENAAIDAEFVSEASRSIDDRHREALSSLGFQPVEGA